jgi:hypothetical protein
MQFADDAFSGNMFGHILYRHMICNQFNPHILNNHKYYQIGSTI